VLCACASAPAAREPLVYRLDVLSDPSRRVHIIEIDRKRVRLETTAGDASSGREYRAQTTSAYARAQGLAAAVNGGYFTPFRGGSPGGEDYYPKAGDPVDVSGAAIAFGRVVSPVETAEDERVNAILCIDDAKVEIRDGQMCAEGADHAMAAGPRLLAGGALRGFAAFGAAYATARHPRTAVGLDADSGTAWIVVVDGRQAGFSEGMSLDELTAVFQRLGAEDALNLDGGGSTTMVLADGAGVRVVNSPIHTAVPGRERPSANHLGVRLVR
jgi:exopolysaccharide biosynthesis protein